LPTIGVEECGNGVIEPPEDCDGYGVDGGGGCRPKGTVGECHLDCSAAAGGSEACPSGWGCDLGGICRRPTGGFEPVRVYEVGTAATLASADFDGDGRSDVLSTEPLDSVGVTRIRFHYFDQQGALSETRAFPHLLLSPAIAEMTGDGLRDVTFTDGRVGVLLGRPDRSWVPETFSSYRVDGSAIRTLTVRDELIDGTSGFVVFSALGDVPGVYVPGTLANGGFPILLGPLPYSTDELVGPPVGAQVIEGSAAPCRQAIVAARGATTFSLLDVCTRAANGAVRWRSELVEQSVALEPPEPIAYAPLVVDMNADGHLDVLIGSETRAFVAYGDGQTLAAAVPLVIQADNVVQTPDGIPMPLAVGDLTADGVVDLVIREGVLLSSAGDAGGGVYTLASTGQAPYNVAAIADLNANGFPDVIAGSSGRPGLTFFNGTGTSSVTLFAIPTTRPVERLVVGDFDGDLVGDVAFSQLGVSEDVQNSVMMSFGVPFGAPLPPAEVARLRTPVEQLGTFREGMLNHLLIASSENTGKGLQGVLTLLTGSGDRIPVALYELTTFADDNSVNGSNALRVLGGNFLGRGPGDVLALGYNTVPTNAGMQFWLLPAIARSDGTPALLAGALPADALPVLGEFDTFRLGAARADLDGDGRDEAILSMPAGDEEHCALYVYGIEPDHVVLRSSVLAAEPCGLIQLATADADGDGYIDLAWHTGRADGSDRQLSMLWNDGAGIFSIERRTIIAGRTASPQAFSVLPASTFRGLSLVYATAFGLDLVPLDGATRGVGEVLSLLALPGCTGLTTADVNGDGASDLVAAARGNLNVLEAALDAL
jgi:hypothetical protein